MEIVMESIQELLRKLCKCIVKSDDGYKINIELEKSDPEPSPDPDPPAPDPDIDPNSPEAKFDPNIPLFIENAQDTPIYFRMECRSEDVNNRNISYSYDNITWQPLIFTKESSSSSSPYISEDIILYEKGDRAYFKGDAADGLVSGTIYPAMFTTNRGIPSDCCVDVGGNITSMFYGKDDKFKTDYLNLSNITHTSSKSMIGTLFGSPGNGGMMSSYIRIPPALPATTLCPGCYEYFFYNDQEGKSRLEYIPVLPAKKLETGCYYSMFYRGSGSSVSDKHDKLYCYTILAEDVKGFLNTFLYAKYFKIVNPDIIPGLGAATGSGTDRLDKHGIIYCPTDPGNKLPTGWKWVKIPPLE